MGMHNNIGMSLVLANTGFKMNCQKHYISHLHLLVGHHNKTMHA